MMNKEGICIYILSQDPVFTRLLEIMLKPFFKKAKTVRIRSFIELKESHISESPDLIILDDLVKGAASLEIISYLRLSKSILSPICFFSDGFYNIKIEAMRKGINCFFNKPFKPSKVAIEIVNNISSNKYYHESTL